MRKSAKRAIKVFDNNKDAVDHMLALIPKSSLVGQYYIQERKGGRTRCENYCSVADFCTQWAMERAALAAPEMFGGADGGE
jgi:hypothetical protein